MFRFARPVLSILCLLELCLVTVGLATVPGVCTGVTSCFCKFDNGQFLDLTTLGHKDGTPRFLNLTDAHEMTYSWNPCYGFSEGPCHNVSVCAIRPAFPDNIYIPLGYHNTSEFQTDTKQGTITLTYTTLGDGQTPTRSSHFSLICENTAVDNSLKALGPASQTSPDYYFELRGKLACPQGSANKPSKSSSKLSDAAKAGIIATTIGVVICGVAILLAVLKRKGKICKPGYDTIESNGASGQTLNS